MLPLVRVPTGGAQRALGRLLRSKVAGDDAPAKAKGIWEAEGPRWFTPDDPIWRVHQHAAMFPGGVAALLLQSLHPSAMAGVAGHSGFRGDPWGRLQRTSYYIAATTFGTIEHAEEVIAHVASIHERVRGRTDDGTPYAASDPDLLSWVHVAEIHSFLTAFQMYAGASERLSAQEADTYVSQARTASTLLGARDLPADVTELREQLHSYRAVLRSTPAAVDACHFLLREPPLPRAAKPGYVLVARGGVAALPNWARRGLGQSGLDVARRADTVAGSLSVATITWAMSGLRDAEERAA
ncbi:oxygenase MpaB family protein [Allobranchiibius huperziae]|uniref:Uncharacterized protein (DUF2236 family) n=1 Tax=Allobranchiibius huperziae TaxID=1874116 RepID=A0A853DPS0_9MICO|nr:oxygenase MpaB family protein [Allobranchiibius huperziae]NYJ76115.1 uncharacterized protein (DUF2236 family) [Allobranchiibius huperziae]